MSSPNKIDLARRAAIADAVALVLRVECGEEEAEEVSDLLELLKQWKSGTVHGRVLPLVRLDPGQAPERFHV